MKAVCAKQKDLDNQQQQKERLRGFVKHSCKAQKIHRRTSMETLIPPTTVWWVVRKHLVMKSYKLQLVQAITADDRQKCKQFCVDMQEKLEEEFNKHVMFSEEATFHTNVKVNRHNLCIWGEENPPATIEHERDSSKVNVLCAISKNLVYDPFFFEGNVTGDVYLQMLQNWLIDELIANEHEDFIYQQDG